MRVPGADHAEGTRPSIGLPSFCDRPQQLRGASVVAEGMAGKSEILARIALEGDILQLVAHGQGLLSERPRLGEPARLAAIFRCVNADQPEPALVGDGTGHGLGLPQVGQHLLELTERVE